MPNHREKGAAEPVRYVGDAVGGLCAGSIGYAVGGHVHFP